MRKLRTAQAGKAVFAILSILAFLPAGLAAATAPHWQAIEQHGDIPPALYEAGISFRRGVQDTVYRFGGDNEEDLVNQFYSLDLTTFTWEKLEAPQAPAGRANTLLIPGPCSNCVSILGGRGEFGEGVMFPNMYTYHVEDGRWEKLPPERRGPQSTVRRAAALVVTVPDAHHPNRRKTFYAFGGVGNTLPRFPVTPTGLRNDVAVYDPDTGWRPVKTFGARPAPRAWTTGAYDPDANAILVFGGYRLGPDQGPDTPGSELFGPTNFENDLWSLSLDTFTWTRLHPKGRLPSPRDNVAAFIDAAHGAFVIWGGQHFDSVTNDLWYYSMAENRWTEVSLSSTDPIPTGRVGGVYFVRETPAAYELYIHCGITNEFGTGVLLNDLWRLTWPKD